jgi:hypothetical protein
MKTFNSSYLFLRVYNSWNVTGGNYLLQFTIKGVMKRCEAGRNVYTPFIAQNTFLSNIKDMQEIRIPTQEGEISFLQLYVNSPTDSTVPIPKGYIAVQAGTYYSYANSYEFQEYGIMLQGYVSNKERLSYPNDSGKGMLESVVPRTLFKALVGTGSPPDTVLHSFYQIPTNIIIKDVSIVINGTTSATAGNRNVELMILKQNQDLFQWGGTTGIFCQNLSSFTIPASTSYSVNFSSQQAPNDTGTGTNGGYFVPFNSVKYLNQQIPCFDLVGGEYINSLLINGQAGDSLLTYIYGDFYRLPQNES